jgi:hypothetical protein
MRFSKKVVAAIVILNVIFTVATLVAFVKVGDEPTALIAAWFSFTTAELWQLANIKKHQINKREKAPEELKDQGTI